MCELSSGPVVLIETLTCSSLVAVLTASPLSDDDVIGMEEGDKFCSISSSCTKGTQASSRQKQGHTDQVSTSDTYTHLEDGKTLLCNSNRSSSCNRHTNCNSENARNQHRDHSNSLTFGCRDVQLWNIQTASRIAVVRFPSKRNEKSVIVPRVIIDSPCPNVEGFEDSRPTSVNTCSTVAMATLPERHFEPVVAVKMSHRRLVVFLDCPSAEIQIFDLKTLRLIHRLERTVVTVPNSLPLSSVSPLSQQLRIAFFDQKAFFGATPTFSLAGVGCLTIHPYLGYLTVPISVPAVDLNSTLEMKGFRFSLSGTQHRRHPPFPVADEVLVSSAAAKGAFSHNKSIGCIGLIDLLGEVRMMKSSSVHQHPISFIACNGAATMIVTASVKVGFFKQ